MYAVKEPSDHKWSPIFKNAYLAYLTRVEFTAWLASIDRSVHDLLAHYTQGVARRWLLKGIW